MRNGQFLPVLLLSSVAMLIPALGAAGIRPGTLLVYYGWPTSINGSFSVAGAALEFGRYDHVVWGDGLEDPAHADHANAVAILAHPATVATRFYGYVDLGLSTQNLPMSEIQARIVRWRAMGVEGVLLDDFGYDFGTGRVRQNAAVDFAHAQGLVVIANAFRPEDAFDSARVPVYNPSGTATHLGPADYYLYESHGVRLGEYEDAGEWEAKADRLQAYRSSLGFNVLSITTTARDDVGAYDEGRFFYAWYAALLFGHAATGWGEFAFAASGASNGQAPYRARPALDPGSSFVTAVTHVGPFHNRQTNLGRIELDTAVHSFGFSLTTVAVASTAVSRVVTLSVAPNPFRAETSLEFSIARAQAVRITLCDPSGRRVSTLLAESLPAGRYHRAWNGRDEAGRRLPAGAYFATLEADDGRSTARLVILR